ncbi:hypothetical protein TTHERM_00077810 (macronuclear) [Tetrahymena thermophila SB210]|uniref:Transmembrane protein n=1 Tax=Tetrahymena thermophila (strain SB210) TaxID=312017 RepID=Q23FY4_TETTS|nr:hypothetical protein TTHERM_00077810 [Tetrahymena thermophila SB210]EAR95476.1 hypothetical protein TTHERM_00077810 [Tetrahymena thermophila SB210]|eukprot:XP_001015721.1 hypothetical protein TTHERM_00077810 [Tetrahymena thermophila SB210]
MKSAALILVSLLVLSSVNAQSSSYVPTFTTNQTALQNYSTCTAPIMTQTPCSASSNAAACGTALTAYMSCYGGCMSKTSYSDFNSCVNTCGTTATGQSSDLSSYVSSMNGCTSKLSGSLLSLSALLLFVLALVF